MGFTIYKDEYKFLKELFGDSVDDVIYNNTELAIRNLVMRWVSLHSYVDFRNEIRKSVIGQNKAVDAVCLEIYTYLQKLAKDKPANNAFLITAPSGNGKTETYRAIRKYFEEQLRYIPCYQYDISTTTESGFRGPDVSEVLCGLDPELEGIGVVFIDELDKKIIPSYDGRGDNCNLKIQHELLTIIEGSYVPKDKKKKINTANTLFIGLGSFDFVRKAHEDKENELGFGAINKETDHFDGISRELIIEAGGCYELVGRFSGIYNFTRLETKDVKKVIELTRSKEEAEFDIPIILRESFVNKLCESANSEYGCRLIKHIMHDRLMKQYKQILEKEMPVDEVTIVLDEKGDSIKRKKVSKQTSKEKVSEMLF